MRKIKFKSKTAAVLAVILSVAAVLLAVNYCITAKYARIAKEQVGGVADYRLVLAVMKAESGFKENAVSPKGAIGIMQIMPDTGEWISRQAKIPDYDESKLYDAETNVKIGSWYLGYLSDRFSHDMALAAYNAGPERVKNWTEEGIESADDIPFAETRKYVKKVNIYYSFYKIIYLF